MAQIVNTYDDVTRPQYNPANSQLTALLYKLQEDRQRTAQNQAVLEEQRRQANQISDYRNKELAARQASEDRYFNTQTGQTEDAKREMAARAQFGYKSLQQDMKTLEADFNNATSHVKRLSAKIMAAGVSPDQLQSLMDGTAKAPAALEQDVKNLIAAGSAQTQAMREADKVTSQYNQQFGIGVILGIDRKNGKFALTNPYIPGQPGQTSQPAAGGGGGGGQPSGLPGGSAAATKAQTGEDDRFFSTNSGPMMGSQPYRPYNTSTPPPAPGPTGAIPTFFRAAKEDVGAGVNALGSIVGGVARDAMAPVAGAARNVYDWAWTGQPTQSINRFARQAPPPAPVDENTPLYMDGSPEVPAGAPIPAVGQAGGAYTSARPNYTDVYLQRMGVPVGFSTEAAAQPITQDEINAGIAARAARNGGTTSYFYPPPPPQDAPYARAGASDSYMNPPAPQPQISDTVRADSLRSRILSHPKARQYPLLPLKGKLSAMTIPELESFYESLGPAISGSGGSISPYPRGIPSYFGR